LNINYINYYINYYKTKRKKYLLKQILLLQSDKYKDKQLFL